MGEKLTDRQRQAVDDRGGKLLVSAAAGSGKTKVLVDRLLKYMMDPIDPANVDDFLIITYTKAAAAELRGKIAQKLAERIAETPENRHLQKQIQRLYLAKISTVHSFCADLLRENAYRMDIPADFRVADENECKQLKETVMTQLLENAYMDINEQDEVRQLIDTQGLGRDDRQVPQIVLKVYHSAKCHLNPEQWLDWCSANMRIETVTDASETVWGKYLIERLHSSLDGHIYALNECAKRADENDTMVKPAALLHNTIAQLDGLRRCSTWQQIQEYPELAFGKLTFTSKCSDMLLAEQIKQVRNACKEEITKLRSWFADSNEQVLQDLLESAAPTCGLVKLVRQFSDAYDSLKRRRRILDFSDLEHKTLDLLLGNRRDHISAAARESGTRFREVMVDEYQDSNAVQDAIFRALTDERQNCFMVGDVKQSIYQFRLADPGIFIDKYNTYIPAEKAMPGQGRKVLLTDNFRSSAGVISAVNVVFTQCMSKTVGGLDYTSDEMLYEGIEHEPLPDSEIEFHALLADEDAYETEANYVAQRITEMLNGKQLVRDKNGLRPVTAGDIVILLRSPGSVGGDFYNALTSRGISCVMGDNEDVLRTEEVSSLISLLQTINNPLQDIPLVATLSSRIFAFTADDLAQIRKGNKHTTFYEALCASDSEKSKAFVKLLSELRNESRIYRLSELIQRIVEYTHIFSIYGALQDGAVRCENIQAFYSFVSNFGCGGQRDLTQLLDHLKNFEDKGISLSADQNAADAVRIMSIHKSKGLEFPVVFLCGLSRKFNMESAYGQVLCDKDLGLGLNVTNAKQRVRYPNIAKRAISAAIVAQSKSEEMRVLYVAMTRAKDRLIMTYAKKSLAKDIQEIGLRMELTPGATLTADANCPGKWVLQTALRRVEAGKLKSFADIVTPGSVYDTVWKISLSDTDAECVTIVGESNFEQEPISDQLAAEMEVALSYRYPYENTTRIPSKLTATQLKGRSKDMEIAENTRQISKFGFVFREPDFIGRKHSATDKGNALHCFMQYADLNMCTDTAGVFLEVQRLVSRNLMTPEYGELLEPEKVITFATSELGRKVRAAETVLREFKFSVLVDAAEYYPDAEQERILLQGVVDCAVVDEDGITVIDFKTDAVTDSTIDQAAAKYYDQIKAYGKALERIYNLPIKNSILYFFTTGTAFRI